MSKPTIRAVYDVFVTPTEENYRWEPFDNDAIQGELKDWLKANVHTNWTWVREAAPDRRSYVLHFRFWDENDAAKFKLLFG